MFSFISLVLSTVAVVLFFAVPCNDILVSAAYLGLLILNAASLLGAIVIYRVRRRRANRDMSVDLLVMKIAIGWLVLTHAAGYLHCQLG